MFTTMAARWRWRKASSITDLANLRADQLERAADDRAVKACDAHTWATMYKALVALGRAGVVVDAFRPGIAAHGHEYGVEMETRAGVSGFASTEVKDQIDDLLYRAGYKTWSDDAVIDWNIIELWAPGCVEYDRHNGGDFARFRGQPVERMDGISTSWIGGSTDARQIKQAFPTRRSVQRELRQAWLITIADRKWDNSTLFTDLLQLLDKQHAEA